MYWYPRSVPCFLVCKVDIPVEVCRYEYTEDAFLSGTSPQSSTVRFIRISFIHYLVRLFRSTSMCNGHRSGVQPHCHYPMSEVTGPLSNRRHLSLLNPDSLLYSWRRIRYGSSSSCERLRMQLEWIDLPRVRLFFEYDMRISGFLFRVSLPFIVLEHVCICVCSGSYGRRHGRTKTAGHPG